jgi:hypothetical protein
VTGLSTTNVLLGIMAAVSVLEALAVAGCFFGAFLLYKRFVKGFRGLEERQVAPVAARVNAILDDVKSVTSTVKGEVGSLQHGIGRIIESLRRWRQRE